RGFFVSASERAAFANGSLLETTFGVKRFNAFIFPQDNNPMIVGTERNTGNFFNRQDRFSDRYDGQVVYNLATFQAAGSHALKVGLDFSYSTFDGRDSNNPIRVTRADGTLSQLINFVGAGRIERNKSEETFFIQDKYSITPSLILDLGLRYDRDGLSTDNNLAPRFRFLYIPFKDS